MANHITYIGARYVPKFAQPAQWSKENEYEPLTIVLNQGNSYTSRRAVPKGIDLKNDEYWAMTGNYNAQIELYRAEVDAFDGRIKNAQDTANTANTKAEAAQATADANTAAIAAETERAQGEEAYLEGEISRVSNEVAAETERATGAEAVNAAAIAAETERARAAENSNAGKIAQNAVDIKKNAADIKYKPMCGIVEPEYLGRFVGTFKESVQAATKFNDTIIQYIQGERSGDGTNFSANGTVYARRDGSNTVTRHPVSNWYHCNSIAFDGTYLYVAPLYGAGETYVNTILKVNPANFSTVQTYTLPIDTVYAIAHDPITKKFYVCSHETPKQLYTWNPEDNTCNLIGNIADITSAKIQDITAYNNLIIIANYDPNYITVCDLDLNVISRITFPETVGFHPFQELESVTAVENGDIFINYATVLGHSSYRFANVAKFNLFSGSKTVILDNPLHYATPNAAYVTQAPINTIFYADGSPENPFPTLLEACIEQQFNPFCREAYAIGTFNENIDITCSTGRSLRIQGQSDGALTINGQIETDTSDCEILNTIIKTTNKPCIVTEKSGNATLYNVKLYSGTANGISVHGSAHLQTGTEYHGSGKMIEIIGAHPVYAYSQVAPTISAAHDLSIYLPVKTIQ